jgi:16S rRNA (adenine(1408)-N(1))-methyltransferase
MEVLQGKKSVSLSPAAFHALHTPYERVWIDLGCGDGKLVYRLARAQPELFCIGIDPARENLRDRSARAVRAPKKGGAPNLLYVIEAVETLDPALTHVATTLTVLFPWAGLLRALLGGQRPVLHALRGLMKAGASLELLLNAELYRDDRLLERLSLPALDAHHIETVLAPGLRDSGFDPVYARLLPNQRIPHRTRWGRRLAAAHPDGQTWQIEATAID